MVSLLFIISFIIHIVTIMMVYHLSNQLRTSNKNNTDEIEQLLSTYLSEIKEENNRLQHELTKRNNKNRNIQSNKLDNYLKDEDKTEININTHTTEHDNIVENIVEDNVNSDVVETSIEAKTLQLYNEGYSIIEIAQKLNRGKTEISLIIDLTKRELK